MEITFHHICHILLGTRMLLNYIAGEKTIQEHKYQKVEIIEGEHPRICLPQQLCTYYFNYVAQLMVQTTDLKHENRVVGIKTILYILKTS